MICDHVNEKLCTLAFTLHVPKHIVQEIIGSIMPFQKALSAVFSLAKHLYGGPLFDFN